MRLARRAVAAVLAALLAVSGSMPWRTARPALLTDDRNHDGRADVWRWYDAGGRLIRVAVDSNFDARTDEVAEFDPETSEIVLEETDTNLNGTADVLRLYTHGAVVYTERAAGDAASQVFNDPYLGDLVAQASDEGPRALVAALVSGNLAPQPPPCAPGPSRTIHFPHAPSARSTRRQSTPLRGPPARSL